MGSSELYDQTWREPVSREVGSSLEPVPGAHDSQGVMFILDMSGIKAPTSGIYSLGQLMGVLATWPTRRPGWLVWTALSIRGLMG